MAILEQLKAAAAAAEGKAPEKKAEAKVEKAPEKKAEPKKAEAKKENKQPAKKEAIKEVAKEEKVEIDLSGIEAKETDATNYLKSILVGMGFSDAKVTVKEIVA